MTTPRIAQAFRENVLARSTTVASNWISTRLIAVYFALQLADILLMILACGRGYFQHGAGPIANLFGLNELAVWAITKTLVFVLLFGAIITGRRRLILFLNLWFAVLLIWTTVMLTIV